MNFDIVKRQIIQEYLKLYGTDHGKGAFSLGDCITIFRYFYNEYYNCFHEDHPRLRNDTIREIIEAFPFKCWVLLERTCFDFEPGDYPAMIDE